MNSLVKVFSNFKEFYSEINGATLTGAIDVIVVEQPDGEFQCSPFHVRFGKLGVLRSREKVVDIEINGEPVDIHMKLGESGEAFFVEECPEEDVEELPDNMATSPIPTNHFPEKYLKNGTSLDNDNDLDKNASDTLQIPMTLPLPRRNSIDFSKESAKESDEPSHKFENQISDYSHRRHTDNTLERRNLSEKLKEYTTQKLRQEWAEHEEIFQFDAIDKDKDWSNSTQTDEKRLESETKEEAEAKNAVEETKQPLVESLDTTLTSSAASQNVEKPETATTTVSNKNNLQVQEQKLSSNTESIKEESKSKKKRRKKSQMKKKNAQRKTSSSSSLGSNTPVDGTPTTEENNSNKAAEDADTSSLSISNNTNNSSNDEASPKSVDAVTALAGDESQASEQQQQCKTSPITPTTTSRIHDLDIHFFSDTEVTSSGGNGACGIGRGAGRPSSPIQSDSELEISLREKETDSDLMTSSASWKWGELPTPEVKPDVNADSQAARAQAQHNSMLSNMFNFMKKNNKMRKQGNDGGIYLADAEGMDPEMLAMYIPNANSASISKENSPAVGNLQGQDDDRESGNGTSLPHSPSSLEGQKSLDSDYEDGKAPDGKYLDFVAMSLCGLQENRDPSDEEFERNAIKYKDDAIEQLMVNAKQDAAAAVAAEAANKADAEAGTPTGTQNQAKRSWWYWRRSQNVNQAAAVAPANSQKSVKIEDKQENLDQTAVATTQTSRPNSPDFSDRTLSKTDSTMNAENTSAIMENMEDLSQASSKSESTGDKNKNEHYKKSLRLSSEAIKKLNLKEGMNEIEFSVTTAYQGTTRCKCYLFRWRHSDKVVISDIDGTITKSDVLGHILPMVGKDWAQLGVAQLFSKIEQNGYKLLYLSARAIGQSRATREYLRSIRQGDVKLPDGPLLLNPTSLISAFHREVIERKPEQFKIACLSDIRDLFPNKDPFYAGYGNRINDVWAYRAVGIPIKRIFTINTKGELKHELTQTFQSSYCSMTYIVDQLFPPIKPDEAAAFEFSNFNYWRDPIPEIDLFLDESANNTTGGGSANTTLNNSVNSDANTTTNSSLSKTLMTIPEN
ncbi:phosphatidate phosphatase LPIN1 isoform X4 [Musca domestica]|uniref:Phosphatidate phosphatase LPIN1 isoform X5 n=1 Tax=Musca domestica TaxID=7370 RepID=A0A1I8MAK1_MUSDO|nr:phosphatidate phosphatase LPIN1 isoform X4 [Musca domestica]